MLAGLESRRLGIRHNGSSVTRYWHNGSSVSRYWHNGSSFTNLVFDSLLQVKLVCCICFIPPESNIVH